MLGLVKKAFKRLEPYDGKLSSTVLRGRRERQRSLCYPTLIALFGILFLSSFVNAQNAYQAEALARQQEAKAIVKAHIQGHINQVGTQGVSKETSTPCLSSMASGHEANPPTEFDEETDQDPTDQGTMGCKVVPLDQRLSGLISQSKKRPSDSLQKKHQQLSNEQLIVFISFSMPEESLKALFAALEQNPQENAKVKLVLRGLIDDSMEKTMRRLSDLGGVCEIDPELFDTFQIQVVPTFVLAQKDVLVAKLSGNITLAHAQEIFSKKASYEIPAKGETP